MIFTLWCFLFLTKHRIKPWKFYLDSRVYCKSIDNWWTQIQHGYICGIHFSQSTESLCSRVHVFMEILRERILSRESQRSSILCDWWCRALWHQISCAGKFHYLFDTCMPFNKSAPFPTTGMRGQNLCWGHTTLDGWNSCWHKTRRSFSLHHLC